jgi:hypothetical protein
MEQAVTVAHSGMGQKAPGCQGTCPLFNVRWSREPCTVGIPEVRVVHVTDGLDTTRNTLGVSFMAHVHHAHSTCTIGARNVPRTRACTDRCMHRTLFGACFVHVHRCTEQYTRARGRPLALPAHSHHRGRASPVPVRAPSAHNCDGSAAVGCLLMLSPTPGPVPAPRRRQHAARPAPALAAGCRRRRR